MWGTPRFRPPRDRVFALIDLSPGRLGHVHVSDNFGAADDHLPVGAGTAPVAAALKRLRETGYDATITLEVFSPDRDYLSLSLSKVRALWEEDDVERLIETPKRSG